MAPRDIRNGNEDKVRSAPPELEYFSAVLFRSMLNTIMPAGLLLVVALSHPTWKSAAQVHWTCLSVPSVGTLQDSEEVLA